MFDLCSKCRGCVDMDEPHTSMHDECADAEAKERDTLRAENERLRRELEEARSDRDRARRMALDNGEQLAAIRRTVAEAVEACEGATEGEWSYRIFPDGDADILTDDGDTVAEFASTHNAKTIAAAVNAVRALGRLMEGE